MKLWDVLSMCTLLLSIVGSTPLPQSWQASGKKQFHLEDIQQEPSSVRTVLADHTPSLDPIPVESESIDGMLEDEQFEEVVEFIQATIRRVRRSSERRRTPNHQKGTRQKDISSKRGHAPKGRRSKGCVLKEIHLNVTDLELGYHTKEELKFKYCSGSCDAAGTIYDRILANLSKNQKFIKDRVWPEACCRPIAFDDDLSFLDDNLMYHTLKKHSAKKCGCI
ncbi:glial cell line-derived neurotrophic factor [Protopterus annectens]|uniref:glial cell line-derived neurotrophic factor n=1 Tax=Protopterus annectens TaxID=7888 RepID=UPI001CFC1D05|nr:glial cell line-derived neurotrophic factor [Protopterus annectens]